MTAIQINHSTCWQSHLPYPDASSHKYSRGYVLIQGGYPITGAARLAAMAAARIGAGITAIAAPEVALPIYASQLLSIMVKPYSEPSGLQALINDQRIAAFLIGPGAGISEITRQTTLNMLHTGKPTVMDADALTAFAGDSASLRAHLPANCVLTPHAGEFQSLFDVEPSDLTDTRVAQVQTAALDTGAVVLLKGSHSIIAAPDGRVIINQHAPPTLATAGAGDVLAGMIAGLIAQHMPAFEATAAATWIHGEAARLFGGMGLIAEDLPELVPTVVQALVEAP